MWLLCDMNCAVIRYGSNTSCFPEDPFLPTSSIIKGIVTLYKQPWYYFLRDRVHVRCACLGSREHPNHERDGAFFQYPSKSRRLSVVPKNGPVERNVRTTISQHSECKSLYYCHYICTVVGEVANLVEGERGLDESITYLATGMYCH